MHRVMHVQGGFYIVCGCPRVCMIQKTVLSVTSYDDMYDTVFRNYDIREYMYDTWETAAYMTSA